MHSASTLNADRVGELVCTLRFWGNIHKVNDHMARSALSRNTGEQAPTFYVLLVHAPIPGPLCLQTTAMYAGGLKLHCIYQAHTYRRGATARSHIGHTTTPLKNCFNNTPTQSYNPASSICLHQSHHPLNIQKSPLLHRSSNTRQYEGRWDGRR